MPPSAIVLSPWTGGFIGPLIENGFEVKAGRIRNRVVHDELKRRFKSIKDARNLPRSDILVSFDEPVTNVVMNSVRPHFILTRPDLVKAVMTGYTWVSVKIQCLYYCIPEAKDIPVFIAIKKGDGDKEALKRFTAVLGSTAKTRASIVQDVIPSKKRFLLYPSSGRTLFSTNRPCPELLLSHWPIVKKYQPLPSDISMDSKGAKCLSVHEVALIHSVDPPPHNLTRQGGFEAVIRTFPIPLAKVMVKTMVETIHFDSGGGRKVC